MTIEVVRQTLTRKHAPDIPRRYWDDSRWINTHLAELAKLYPNCWIIVYNSQVVAADRDLGKAEDAAEQIIGPVDKSFPAAEYVESGRHVF
ncbi:MAG TPA: DUF5678 domain-containing protein [Anaerolineae bacterium]